MGSDQTTATLKIELDDDVSGAAEEAATALQSLRNAIASDTRELNALRGMMKNLQQQNTVDVKQYRELKAAIDAKSGAIFRSQQNIVALGGKLSATAKAGKGLKPALSDAAKGTGDAAAAAKTASSAFEVFASNAGKLPGPLGQLVSRAGSLREMFKGLASHGLVLKVAVAALVVTIIGATAALTKYGIAQADVRRSEMLRLEGLTKMRNWWGIAAGNAKEMQASLDAVENSTALGRAELGRYQQQLYQAGLRGDNLNRTLEAMAIKSSVQGEAAAQQFAYWAIGAGLAGGSVKKLTDDVKARLGGIALRQMMSLNVMSEKLRANLGHITDGLKIEGFLTSLKSIMDMFSQTTAIGRSLKSMFTALFQPIVDGLTVGLGFKRFMQGMIIVAQQFVIVWLRLRLWIKQVFGKDLVTEGAKAKFWLYVGVIGAMALATAFLILAGNVLLATWPFLLAAAAVWGFYELVTDLCALFDEIDWSGLGKSIVDGVVNGIKAGFQKAKDAVKLLTNIFTQGFRGPLGIHSPSRLFAELGLAIPQGVVLGVERGRPQAEKSVRTLVEMPPLQLPETSAPEPARAPTAPPPPPAAAPKQAAQVNVNIDQLHIHAGGNNARDMAADFKAELVRLLEGVAIELGASPA